MSMKVTYTPHLCVLFVDAFDIYLHILHHIQSILKRALGHDGSEWKL